MFVLTNDCYYIGKDFRGRPIPVLSKEKAILFKTEQAAKNCSNNLSSTLKNYMWRVEPVNDTYPENTLTLVTNIEKTIYNPNTRIDDDNFDICTFFSEVINIMSQIDKFISNMTYKEETADMKILDVRHYLRNNNHKLNAIQMQRLGYYLQDLEIERYECKSKRLIASMFANNINALKDVNNIAKMQDVLTSHYRPRVLEDTDIDYIINKKKNEELTA